MAAGAIRGSRVGAGPMGEDERGRVAPRQVVAFLCANGHSTELPFALEAELPAQWDCPRCGLPASAGGEAPPSPVRTEPYKTHLAYAKERRSDTEAAKILDEAISTLRTRRKTGEIVL